jgi:hypothetical protein
MFPSIDNIKESHIASPLPHHNQQNQQYRILLDVDLADYNSERNVAAAWSVIIDSAWNAGLDRVVRHCSCQACRGSCRALASLCILYLNTTPRHYNTPSTTSIATHGTSLEAATSCLALCRSHPRPRDGVTGRHALREKTNDRCLTQRP